MNLVLRIVTRGTNKEAIKRTVKKCLKLNCKRIEVITDNLVNAQNAKMILVPTNYQSPNGAKWKARALDYAAKYHSLKNEWYLHLDEESIPTEECIKGCKEFIKKHKNGLAVGQGEVLYNGHGYKITKLTCLADSLRTGDDLLRFRLQYALGAPIFGSHGSFILVSGKVEREYGWDVGAGGSITEDASFAINCWSKGIKFGWVKGQVIEQSPYNYKDFIKQRRRWFNGLWKVALSDDFKLRHTFILMMAMVYWSFTPMIFMINIALLLFGLKLPVFVVVMGSGTFLYYFTAYLLGALRNGRIRALFATFFFLPVLFFFEASAVFYAIIRPIKVFEIIKKD